jgi:5-methylcytosine-specific restriction endonuclease McrA
MSGNKNPMYGRCGDKHPRFGKKYSDEKRKQISEHRKGKCVGKDNPFYGKDHTPEVKEIISKANKGKKLSERHRKILSECNMGEKNFNWNGGTGSEPYTPEFMRKRKFIRERDNYTCQLCQKYGKTVHHIDYDKKNSKGENLITLCNICNNTVNHKREFWKNFFIKLMESKLE